MKEYDVVVIGGSSAGVGAALAAGRMGATVALVEDTPVLGGMLSNGVSNIDLYSLESSSGIFEEFRQAVKAYYLPQMDNDPLFGTRMIMASHMDGRSRQANDPDEGGRWEPHVADRILKNMVAQVPTVDVFYNRHPTDVVMSRNRIVGVVAERSAENHAYAPAVSGDRIIFKGSVIIDASHEADVAAWAGVPYCVGREGRSRLEPHAGDIRFFNQTGEIIGGSGRQDRAIVSYGVRLCVKIYPSTSEPSHLLESPPRGYNPAIYEPTLISKTKPGEPIPPGVPNGKIEINENPIGSERQEINWSWPEATRAERNELYEIYCEHALGFLYYLQHVKGFTQLGLPIDEFTDNGGVPYRVFVREARRIEGEATVTEADINPFILANSLQPPLRSDSIAIGHYPIDSKPVQEKTDLAIADKGPGDFFLVNASAPFQVPYGAIVPKKIDGLLVPAALSATHVAFSAIRMDPTWMALGQAAGVAAVVSLRERVPVRATRVAAIQRELIRQNSKLMFYWDLPATHPAFAAAQWLTVRGTVTGDPDRCFQPDKILTRAELAAMLCRGLDMWPSVSDAHFVDLPYDHWAFRYLETLFDNQALHTFGVRPLWPDAGPYEPGHAGFSNAHRDQFGLISPDEPVTWHQVLGVVHALTKPNEVPQPSSRIDHVQGHSTAGIPLNTAVLETEFGRQYLRPTVDADDTVTRGEFSAYLAALIDSTPLNNKDYVPDHHYPVTPAPETP